MSKQRYSPTDATGLRQSTSTAIPTTTVGPIASSGDEPPRDIRLETAIEHLRDMWADAIGPQIGGRRFFGEIRIRVPFMDGRAQDLFGEKEWRDRVAGGH
jgi:hypothetical protein